MSASLPPEIPVNPPVIPPVQPGGPVPQLAPKKPSWPKVVGILGIIFGAFGVIGGAQLMATPSIMEFQKGMMSNMEKLSERQDFNRRNSGPPPKEVFKMVKKMWDTPEWFDTWCMVGGALAVIISGFYVFAAIRILQIKPGATGLFYSAAGLAIALALVKVAVAVSLGSLMSIGMMVGAIVGGIADIVLFIVVASGSKEMFAAQSFSNQ